MANPPKPLKPGSNFSLRLPQDIDSELLAELNKKRRNRNFNTYAISVLLRGIRSTIKVNEENQPAQTRGVEVSESDLENAIERALTRMLKGRIPPLPEAAETPLDDVKTEAVQPPNDAAVADDQTAAEHTNTEPKKDPTRRMKNRMAGRDALKASESFGDRRL